jgi:hypothetical protein
MHTAFASCSPPGVHGDVLLADWQRTTSHLTFSSTSPPYVHPFFYNRRHLPSPHALGWLFWATCLHPMRWVGCCWRLAFTPCAGLVVLGDLPSPHALGWLFWAVSSNTCAVPWAAGWMSCCKGVSTQAK